jgi:hypothetical protein
VEFVERDVATPLEQGGFDVAFARLVLTHLVDPMAAVRARGGDPTIGPRLAPHLSAAGL